MLHKKACIFGYWVTEHGDGEFGIIYSGVEGQDAVNFLLKVRSGEIRSAFTKDGLGEIDLIYGVSGLNGYGLAHIIEFHVQDLDKITLIIENGIIVTQAPDRKLLVYESPDKTYISAIKLDWNGKSKKWLVTAYGKNTP
ncbi:MAG: hypothetical protein NT003_05225 [Candidatus Magasanikbacteria bacterium]|nr:hypothetical protein [Candidatus Magasanikbacteria bacterium]